LEVRTARNALLVAVGPNSERPWLFHADYLRRRIRAHERQLQSMSDDTKVERSPMTAGTRTRLQTLSYRQRNYMDSELRRLVATLVAFADRIGMKTIRYDDTCRRFCEQFPWAELRRMITEKCDNQGLEFVLASGDVVQEENVDENGTTNEEQGDSAENSQ
jgi:hypothetical protein